MVVTPSFIQNGLSVSLKLPKPIPRSLHVGAFRYAINPSVYAGAENRADVHVQPSGALCQRKMSHFHRYLLVFTLFLLF
jgi:hypothetical protein